jgi:hypothetical protein
MFCRDGWWAESQNNTQKLGFILYKRVPLTKDSSMNNIAEDSEIVTLWKKPSGVSILLAVLSRYAVFLDLILTLCNTVRKERESAIF